MMNLMINGVDAMKDVDGARELAIKAQKAPILVSVSDTGVGLPVHQADQIFKAFFTTNLKGPAWTCPSATPSLNRMAGACGLHDNTPRGANLYFTLPTKAEVKE